MNNREIRCKLLDDETNRFVEPDADNVYWNCTEGILTAHNEGGKAADWRELTICMGTGLKDKNGTEIFEKSILHIKHKIGDNENHYFDGYYQVDNIHYAGVSLSFLKLSNDDKNNQYPIHSTLSFQYGQLDTDYENNNALMLRDTWGENNLHRHRWRQNHRSKDVEVIGTIYTHPGLLK